MTKQIKINEEFKNRPATWLTALTKKQDTDNERINFESAGATKKGTQIGQRG